MRWKYFNYVIKAKGLHFREKYQHNFFYFNKNTNFRQSFSTQKRIFVWLSFVTAKRSPKTKTEAKSSQNKGF